MVVAVVTAKAAKETVWRMEHLRKNEEGAGGGGGGGSGCGGSGKGAQGNRRANGIS